MRINILTTEYMGSNCYLVIEKGHAIILDPGDAELVIKNVQKEELVIDRCILTHEHCDHVYGCSKVREELHCKIIARRVCFYI